jgi:hypothetical protein
MKRYGSDVDFRTSAYRRLHLNAGDCLACLIAGLGAGSILAYYMDEERGVARRHILADQLCSLGCHSSKAINKISTDLCGRAKGTLAGLRSSLRTETDLTDERLTQRVRSQIGRATSHPKSLEITARDGVVSVWGLILSHEAEGVLSCIRNVRGVKGVNDELERRSSAEGIPELQGGRQIAAKNQSDWPTTILLGAGSIAAVAFARSVTSWMNGPAGAGRTGTGFPP